MMFMMRGMGHGDSGPDHRDPSARQEDCITITTCRAGNPR